jgi:hypothetical protein
MPLLRFYHSFQFNIEFAESDWLAQWPKEKGQKDKQRFTKHTYTTKDQVTRTPPKIVGELK